MRRPFGVQYEPLQLLYMHASQLCSFCEDASVSWLSFWYMRTAFDLLPLWGTGNSKWLCGGLARRRAQVFYGKRQQWYQQRPPACHAVGADRTSCVKRTSWSVCTVPWCMSKDLLQKPQESTDAHTKLRYASCLGSLHITHMFCDDASQSLGHPAQFVSTVHICVWPANQYIALSCSRRHVSNVQTALLSIE